MTGVLSRERRRERNQESSTYTRARSAIRSPRKEEERRKRTARAVRGAEKGAPREKNTEATGARQMRRGARRKTREGREEARPATSGECIRPDRIARPRNVVLFILAIGACSAWRDRAGGGGRREGGGHAVGNRDRCTAGERRGAPLRGTTGKRFLSRSRPAE